MMNRLVWYLNPIAHLGNKNYSLIFPFLGTLLPAVLLEVYAYYIVDNPAAIGLAAIFIFIALIMYFSFREGIKGGVIASTITIAYYFYIIYTRYYQGQQLIAGIQTTIILGVLYYLLSGIIGWLKQIVDTLIERETDEKKRLQAVIQQLPVGVVITDHNGTIVQANKRSEEILGTKIPIGFTFGEKHLVNPKYNGKVIPTSQSPLVQAVTAGKSIVGKEYSVNRKDGKEVHILVNSSPIHNKAQKVIAAALIIIDITEQKNMEERKDDFVNMASHELKTPLTSMKLYIDSLSRTVQKNKDKKSSRILNNIKKQTERLQTLVNDLLDVSRLQTGKLMFNKEKFNLSALIEESLEVLHGSTNNQQIIFTKKPGLQVYADKFRIYQVITNIITNAIKYSPEGKTITVKVYKEKNKAVVLVQDQGIGIQKDEQKRIFERLYQVSDTNQKTFPGFGMGLFISKEIVKRHQGKIWVESEKGKGSTFYFTLPLD